MSDINDEYEVFGRVPTAEDEMRLPHRDESYVFLLKKKESQFTVHVIIHRQSPIITPRLLYEYLLNKIQARGRRQIVNLVTRSRTQDAKGSKRAVENGGKQQVEADMGIYRARWLSSTSALVTRRTQTVNPLSVRKQKMRDELLHSMDAADNRSFPT